MATIPELSAYSPVPGWDNTTPALGVEMNTSLIALVGRDNYVRALAEAAQASASAARFRTGRNLLINCGLPINQRIFAGGALSAFAYGYDRWRSGASTSNVSINASTGVFTHNSGPLQQVVEIPYRIASAPLTLSVENPTGSIAVTVGSASGTITAGTGRRSVTLNPTGTGNLTVQLAATGVTYSRPQLEWGDVATDFEFRPPSDELALCQRYYEKSYNLTVAPGTAASNPGRRTASQSAAIGSDCFMSAPFAIPKRGTPSVLIYAPASGTVSRVTVDNNADVPGTIIHAAQTGFEVSWNPGSGRWGGWFHFTAEAEL